jgi:hypothetical protein
MAQAIFQSGGLGLVEFTPVSGPRYGGQCYVVADETKILLAFRGTQVVKSEHSSDLARLNATVKTLTATANCATIPGSPGCSRMVCKEHRSI